MKRPRSIAIVAGALVAGLALAACSSSSGGSGANGGSGGAGSSTGGTSGGKAVFNAANTGIVNPSTTKGGTLTYGVAATPDSFDPGNTYYAWVLNLNRLWATPLLTYKSCTGGCGDTLAPGIATGLGTTSDNGLVWTYHIKQGLKFEDGTPITTADVKYAVERTYDRSVMENGPTYFENILADPTYKGPYKDPTGNLTSITTPDDYTIQFHLQSAFPDFNYVVGAISQTAPVEKAKDTGANYQLHPQSTGPYMFQSYSPNKQLVLVPNPNWTQNEDPQAKQLASKIVVDLNLNQQDLDNRLLAGDIDIDAQGVGVGAAARAKILSNPTNKANADVVSSNRLWFTYISSQVAPLNNLACRQAVEYAANKTDLQTAWGGPYAGRPDRDDAAAARHGRVQRVRPLQREDGPDGRHHVGQGGAHQVRPAERLHDRRRLPQRPAGRDRGHPVAAGQPGQGRHQAPAARLHLGHLLLRLRGCAELRAPARPRHPRGRLVAGLAGRLRHDGRTRRRQHDRLHRQHQHRRAERPARSTACSSRRPRAGSPPRRSTRSTARSTRTPWATR